MFTMAGLHEVKCTIYKGLSHSWYLNINNFRALRFRYLLTIVATVTHVRIQNESVISVTDVAKPGDQKLLWLIHDPDVIRGYM